MSDWPAGYLAISEAVHHLGRGIWGGLRRPHIVGEVKKKQPRLSAGSEAWRETAARALREAAISGKLTVYVRSGDQSAPASDAIPVPPLVVLRMIPIRGGLPDHVFRPAPKLVEGLCNARPLWTALNDGILLVHKSEFAAWYRSERRRHRWPSQKGSKKPRVGRPSRNDGLRLAIEAIVNAGSWAAEMPIARLRNELTRLGRFVVPSHDTIAREVDRMSKETGDSRFARPRRRRKRAEKRSYAK